MAKGKGSVGDKKLKKKSSAAAGNGDEDKASKASVRNERKKGKGKKFVVNDDSVKIMRKTLAGIGCKLNEVEADGNCLFRALGDQLFGDQQQHVEIRKRVVDYIESKRTDFEPFMEDEEKFEHYCKRMREDSTWGGNQELYAAARLFSVYIVIHQESSRMVIECDAQKPKSVLHIAYHGSDHYDSVRSLRDTDMNAPPVEIELEIDGFRPDDLRKRWKTHAATASVAATTAVTASDDLTTSHRIASSNSGPVGDVTSDLEALCVSRSSSAAPVVLSKKAQRLLKKQARSSTAAKPFKATK